VTFGEAGSQRLLRARCCWALRAAAGDGLVATGSPALLLPLLLLPAACTAARLHRCPRGTAFNEVLFRTFRLELWFAALLSAGALLGRMLA
jgi:1,4-dihydroxy-2-naphthoate octaprenyltransferase